MPPHIARLAGLGAYAASVGLLVLAALFVFATRPTRFSGMDPTMRAMTWISVIGVIVALVAVHVMLGRRLLKLARGERERA